MGVKKMQKTNTDRLISLAMNSFNKSSSKFPSILLKEHTCHKCGRKLKTWDEIEFYQDNGECIACDNARGEAMELDREFAEFKNREMYGDEGNEEDINHD